MPQNWNPRDQVILAELDAVFWLAGSQVRVLFFSCLVHWSKNRTDSGMSLKLEAPLSSSWHNEDPGSPRGRLWSPWICETWTPRTQGQQGDKDMTCPTVSCSFSCQFIISSFLPWSIPSLSFSASPPPFTVSLSPSPTLYAPLLRGSERTPQLPLKSEEAKLRMELLSRVSVHKMQSCLQGASRNLLSIHMHRAKMERTMTLDHCEQLRNSTTHVLGNWNWTSKRCPEGVFHAACSLILMDILV